jgi:hypothetical protein
MRQAPIGILALGIILSLCGIASAATHTISWSPVVTYTDGAAINGKTVSYSLYWSTTPRLTSITMFDYGLTRTSRTFDPAALGMAVGRTVYFTMRTKLSTGEASGYASPRAWVVPGTSPNTSGNASNGSPAVTTGNTGASTSTAPQSSGTTSASKAANLVQIVLSGPASPGDLRIGKLEPSPAPDTWRLSWSAVTEFANGREFGSGQTVRYNAYWTRDPSLSAGNLVAVATSTAGSHVDFRPLAHGMEANEKVYFTLQATLDSGEKSVLSAPLPWRVSSRGPGAPTNGRIGITGAQGIKE